MLPASQPRHFCIQLVEHWLFEPFIALVITLNCIELAWESPLDPPGTWKAEFIDQTEAIFLYIFTAEMLCKIVAYGFAGHRHAYLSDHYCILDFAVVTLAWVPYIVPGAGNFTGLRTIRAMRPLRTLQYVPGMPTLVASIIQAVAQLGSVLAILGFLFLIFGILGVGLFQGALHYHCTGSECLRATLVHPSSSKLVKSNPDTLAACRPQS